jgi:sterol desaturase/sphingolipid hydroxylase (fatty acid hydroxylase superfamily)
MDLIFKYTGFYFLVLGIFTASYFILSGTSYCLLYIIKKDQLQPRKIQTRETNRKSIYREIRSSIRSMLVLALLTMLLLISIQKGYTRMYNNIKDYGWLYFFTSIFFCILLNDTYFYWMHRFMHLKAIFPRVHKVHHLSKTPTPWAIFAFSPVESLIDFAIFPLLIFFIPLHPVSAAIIVGYNHLMNLAGHFGFEFVPKKFHDHWIFRYSLSVTHHDMHHAKVNCNYGLYFNIWDRLMKTNHPDYKKTFLKIQEQIEKKDFYANTKPAKKNRRTQV